MAKSPDILAMLPDDLRSEFMKELAVEMLGPVAGAAFAKQMDAVQNFSGRQLGDATEPEMNYWKGVWQIYEID